jgi:hypothetical protein
MLKKFVIALVLLVVIITVYGYLAGSGLIGKHQAVGIVANSEVPAKVVAQRLGAKALAAANLNVTSSKQILFGDFHVHTTFSNDAYTAAMPIMGGEGSKPPADACDYARYCSALDFWSINDHAVSLSSKRWQETKDSIRQCNAVTDPANPDVVAFLGFEWTHANPATASKHWGHKNVIYKSIEEENVAARPVYAEAELGPSAFNAPFIDRALLALAKLPNNDEYIDYNLYLREMEEEPTCPKGVHTNDLPLDCKEGAATPAELFTKLDDAGHEAIVIPHGNAWGLYTPPETTWDKQLVGANQDESRQYMIEVFSGHGNSEEYREFTSIVRDENGVARCAPIQDDFLPMCQQAANIIMQRCLDDDEAVAECEQRAEVARNNAAQSVFPFATVTRTTIEEWLDADQCRDCFLPSYNYRPGGSAQYAMALGNFDDPDNIRRFRFAMMASSDNHKARPGTGYKEYGRRQNAETFVVTDDFAKAQLDAQRPRKQSSSIAVLGSQLPSLGAGQPLAERASGFFMTGGLVAVHAENRQRESIWNALEQKEIYATSGDRILLWFDMLNPDLEQTNVIAPMGAELTINHNPTFRVRAAGAFKQLPGCPDYSVNAVGEDRLERLCMNECYNPSRERKIISRIEIIRVKPQMTPDENVAELIEDVWLTHQCTADESGCEFEFTDSEFNDSGRETVYYARAIQQPSLAVNADPMRCEYDDNGQCIKVNSCSDANPNMTFDDDCLSPTEERAWSSPIFLNYQ